MGCVEGRREMKREKNRVAVVISTHSIAPLTCKIVYNHPIVLYVCVAYCVFPRLSPLSGIVLHVSENLFVLDEEAIASG